MASSTTFFAASLTGASGNRAHSSHMPSLDTAYFTGPGLNPVKHGHAANVEEWPYSSFHRDHRDAPGPGDLERAMAEFARATSGDKFGERSRHRRRAPPIGPRPEPAQYGRRGPIAPYGRAVNGGTVWPNGLRPDKCSVSV